MINVDFAKLAVKKRGLREINISQSHCNRPLRGKKNWWESSDPDPFFTRVVLKDREKMKEEIYPVHNWVDRFR